MGSALESAYQRRHKKEAGRSRTRQRVTETAKIPAGVNKWKYSCANLGIKKSFSNFFTEAVSHPYMTLKDEVVHSGPSKNMEGKCSYEEANTRIVVHLIHCLQK